MIVNCAVYEKGVRRAQPLAIADAFEEGRATDAFVWIALHDPTTQEFAEVEAELNLHPLATEDAMRAHQRPKLDVFDNTIFVVAKTARYDDTAESITTDEIHVFAGDGFVVTVHHGGTPEHPALRLDPAEAERTPDIFQFGPGAVLYAVLDQVVDEYQSVIEGVENDIDELEVEVFSVIRSNPAERIFRLKRQVLEFQRAVLPLQDVLDRLVRQQVPETCRHPDLSEYFRDVHDHTMRVAGRIDTARDTLGAALDANLAQVSVRQNDDMRAISGWAAVIAVPTLFAGIWGMNFQHMPELNSLVGYPIALATIFASGWLVRRRLRRNGWL